MSLDYIMRFMQMILELRPHYLTTKDDVLNYMQVTRGGLHQNHLLEAMEYQLMRRWLKRAMR